MAQIAPEVSLAVKPNGFATKHIMMKPKIRCACVLMKESSANQREKENNHSDKGLLIGWKTEHGTNVTAPAFLI